MAVPIAIASLAATVIGAGVSAYGAYAQGEAQKSMYDYQARVAQVNAQIAEQQANTEQMAGEVRAQKAGLAGEFQREEDRAKMAAGGFLDPRSGSGKAVLESETEITQHDEAMTRYDSAQRAYALRVQGAQDTMQGNLDVAAGVGAQRAGTINTYASLLGGATSFGDRYTKYGPSGLGILS